MAVEPIPANRTERRRARTRAAIVDAALEQFAARGVDATSIQHITDAADVAKGSFYNHFDSKDALLRAAVTETLDELGRALEASSEPLRNDPARVIAACLRHTLLACVQDPTLGWFILRARDVVDLESMPLGDYGRRDIHRGIESGRFRCDDLETAFTMIGGGAQALLHRRLKGELPPEAEVSFTTYALRVLGVPEDQARAIASEDLAPLGRSATPAP